MATEAQVRANRSNAQKSTGPHTAEGKAAVAQNAVKHGLSGRLDVIKGEDQAEFDRQREALLAELQPRGAVEAMLAERAVSLSWRLKRVERMQNEVLDAFLADGATPLARLARSVIPGKAAEDDGLDLGRAVLKDFSNSRVLDRLLMYERRMEHSLLKMLNDLQLRRLRVRDYISRHMDEIGSSQGESFKCEVSSLKSEWSDTDSAELQTSHFQLQTFSEPPYGVTTNAAGALLHHSSIPSSEDTAEGPEGSVAAELSCKTKPICPDAGEGQVLYGVGVREGWAQDGHEETKPIISGETSCLSPAGVGTGD